MKRSEVKEWLDEYHRGSRQWLADQCGKSINTVYSWFSNRDIPLHAQLIIQRLMQADELKRQLNIPQNLVLKFDEDQFKTLERAALLSNQTLTEYSIDRLNKIAEDDILALTKVHNAEDPDYLGEGDEPYTMHPLAADSFRLKKSARSSTPPETPAP